MLGVSDKDSHAMDRLATSLMLLFAAGAASAGTVVEPAWQRHFAAKGVRGTFVLFEPLQGRYTVVEPSRAKQRFLPASTFKIANALIGLEAGSIADENEVFAWDRKPKLRSEWERDQTLATGMRESTVWMFQEVARRTGKAAMREGLERLDYGNRDISGGIDQFWLQGGLRISAREQVELLDKLAEGRLPMTQRAQRLVRQALVVEKTREHSLYAKTGTSGGKEPVAWWVGWIEKKGRCIAVFAMNYSPTSASRFADRFEIARAILAESGKLAPSVD
jgi:beta-lactamase class D